MSEPLERFYDITLGDLGNIWGKGRGVMGTMMGTDEEENMSKRMTL